ncbi:BMP family protein [Moorella naiadis]|uniref:BMP family protein n=1 Tax=Moorella naiadis (nom. illeg.) TaxID=3093670 RepID=UPI003D9CA524
MKKVKIYAFILALMLIVVFTISGCGSKTSNDQVKQNGDSKPNTSQATKLRVALILPGPINDNGWDAIAYNSLMKVKEMGVDVSYRENVGQSDQLEAFRAYATQGYDIIFAHGYQYKDDAKKVARDFPKVKFVVTSNTDSQPPNMASIFASTHQAGFFAGLVAAAASKTGKIAYIGGFDIPAVSEPRDGFVAGAKYFNPKIEVTTAYIGSWDDVAKAKETAMAMIQNGVDVILPNANQAGLGAFQATKEKGVYGIGIATDQSQYAPETVIASSKYYYPMEYVTQEIQTGKFEAKCYSVGIKEDATGLIWNNKLKDKVSADSTAKINQIIADVKAGKIDVDKLAEQAKANK